MSAGLIRVLIADDHPIVRQGLELVINSQPDLALVGQAADGAEAVQIFTSTHPDVVVMDRQMPVKDGLAAIEEIRQTGVPAQILVLTSFPEDDMVIAAMVASNNVMTSANSALNIVFSIFSCLNRVRTRWAEDPDVAWNIHHAGVSGRCHIDARYRALDR